MPTTLAAVALTYLEDEAFHNVWQGYVASRDASRHYDSPDC